MKKIVMSLAIIVFAAVFFMGCGIPDLPGPLGVPGV